MSSFEVKVRRIEKVEDHPEADRLSICTILGYRAITAKVPVWNDGDHYDETHTPETHPHQYSWAPRYKAGDLVVYVPEAAVVPHDLLKQYGYWNHTKDIGMLAGKQGDRVKIIRLRGVYSQGLIWPTIGDATPSDPRCMVERPDPNAAGERQAMDAYEGDDVADFFSIVKYEPPIPASMNGDVAGIAEFAMNYDFDSVQRWPDFFQPGEPVVVTEKLHGTFTRVSFRRNTTDERLFGPNKNIAIASKGLGAKGIVFIDTEKNRVANVYVKAAIENALIAKIEDMADALGADSIDIMGETFGTGIQKFSYGLTKPQFRAFDLRVERTYADAPSKSFNFDQFDISEVPELYDGPFDIKTIEELRDAPVDWTGAQHVREGVVITASGAQASREHRGERMRPILKAVSPAYLLKEDGSEIQ